MTAQDLEVFGLTNGGNRTASITTSNDKDEEFSIPLDISDIINICSTCFPGYFCWFWCRATGIHVISYCYL